MATLKCNSCGGAIASHARRVQCPHCGELFPFVCAQCQRKLRPPFSVFNSESYLSHDDPPLPLCDEHYLRQCPDCENWFGANENPGFFRCAPCARIHAEQQARQASELLAPPTAATSPDNNDHNGGVATQTRPISAPVRLQKATANPNRPAIIFAVCAFVALVMWMILGR